MKLDERARHAAAAVREQAAEADADAVLERIRAPRTRPRWIVPAGAVAVAVALVIAVVAVVLPRIETRPVIDPVVPGDPSPDEPVTPPGDDGAGPGVGTVGTWRRSGSSDLSGPGDQRMAAVASALDARVAVGSDREGAAIWILPSDGGDWMRVEADLCGEASCVLRDVTVSEIGGQRFVIVGSLDGLPKIWSSEDGLTWQRHDLERRPTTVPGVTELTTVVATGGEVVAFGTEQLPDGGSRPVVFTSTDVATWSEGAVAFAGTEAGADVLDATLTSAGDVVAAMHVGDGIALLEREGAGWGTRVVAGEPFNLVTTSVHTIRSTDEGELWLLGSSQGPQDQDGQVWRSSDGGATWVAMSGELGGPGDQHVTDAVLVRGTWTAVGYETDRPGSPPRPVVWDLTDDGWRRTDGGPAFEDPGAMLAVTQGPGHSAFVVGDTTGRQGDGEADAAAWTVEYQVTATATCSTGGVLSESLSDRPDLPAPVEDTRQGIWDRAVRCDLDGLGALALEGRPGFTYSFGDDGAPAAYWRRQESAGEEPILELARLLEGPSSTIETADGTIHVWPAAFASDDGYLGYRVGINEDGDWMYFVAGD